MIFALQQQQQRNGLKSKTYVQRSKCTGRALIQGLQRVQGVQNVRGQRFVLEFIFIVFFCL